jgi:hypothetical protein
MIAAQNLRKRHPATAFREHAIAMDSGRHKWNPLLRYT